jgi:S1-C subfamily serine protease
MSTRESATQATIRAIVAVKAQIPRDAMSAGLLGTERSGHGVRMREDGLIATIGYIVHEAESVWLGVDDRSVPGVVVGYDFDSGFALIRPILPLEGPVAAIGSCDALRVGDPVRVAASGADPALNAEVVARQEFAGRWEYLLEDAVFTSPPHDSWSGAALIDSDGRLCGLGSLVIQGFELNGQPTNVNLFVPIDLLMPHIDDICEHGRRSGPPRPWLGMLVHDDRQELMIVGVYKNCPADLAGLKPGDVILSVNGEPVRGLANMYRRIWRMGSAGIKVPFTVLRDSQRVEALVESADRAAYQHKGTVQ